MTKLVVARHGSYTEPPITPEGARRMLERGDIPDELTEGRSEEEVIDYLADEKELDDEGETEVDKLAEALINTESVSDELSDAVILSSTADRAFLSAKRLQEKLERISIEKRGFLWKSSSNIRHDGHVMGDIQDWCDRKSVVIVITHMYTAKAITKNLVSRKGCPDSTLETGQAFLVDLESRTCIILPKPK